MKSGDEVDVVFFRATGWEVGYVGGFGPKRGKRKEGKKRVYREEKTLEKRHIGSLLAKNIIKGIMKTAWLCV